MLRKINHWIASSQPKVGVSIAAAIAALVFLSITPYSASAAADKWQQLIAQGDEDLNKQDLSDAQNHFRQALKTVEQSSHSINDVVKCQNRLANVMALQNATGEALNLYKKSLEMLEKKYGRQDSHETSTIFALGSVYESLGDHDLAASMYREAFAIHAHKFSHYDPAVASSLPNLNKVAPHPQRSHDLAEGGSGLNAMSLSASHSLVNGVVKSPSEDILKKDDSTDKDLLSDFQKQMLQFNNNANAFAEELRNATVQETALKPSRRM